MQINTLFIIWQELDEDVRNERQMILNKSAPSTSAVVVVQDLVKQFKKRKDNSFFQRQYTAVNHLNFYALQGSCFGLLGTCHCPVTKIFECSLFKAQMELVKRRHSVYSSMIFNLPQVKLVLKSW